MLILTSPPTARSRAPFAHLREGQKTFLLMLIESCLWACLHQGKTSAVPARASLLRTASLGMPRSASPIRAALCQYACFDQRLRQKIGAVLRYPAVLPFITS